MINKFYYDKQFQDFIMCAEGITFSAGFLTCINRYLEMFDFSEEERLEHIKICKGFKNTLKAKNYLNKLTSGDYVRAPLSLL